MTPTHSTTKYFQAMQFTADNGFAMQDAFAPLVSYCFGNGMPAPFLQVFVPGQTLTAHPGDWVILDDEGGVHILDQYHFGLAGMQELHGDAVVQAAAVLEEYKQAIEDRAPISEDLQLQVAAATVVIGEMTEEQVTNIQDYAADAEIAPTPVEPVPEPVMENPITEPELPFFEPTPEPVVEPDPAPAADPIPEPEAQAPVITPDDWNADPVVLPATDGEFVLPDSVEMIEEPVTQEVTDAPAPEPVPAEELAVAVPDEGPAPAEAEPVPAEEPAVVVETSDPDPVVETPALPSDEEVDNLLKGI